MRQVADGSRGSRRDAPPALCAPPFFGLAAQTLDRAAAEDLVQDVFLTVCRNAARFDPERGTVRSWILQIAHFRLLNELRRRSRQPEAIPPDPEGLVLEGHRGRRSRPGGGGVGEGSAPRADQSAFDALPPPQREAVELAFVDDLTHEQVAAELGLPLGTAKTRIRTGLKKLRVVLGAAVGGVGRARSAGRARRALPLGAPGARATTARSR